MAGDQPDLAILAAPTECAASGPEAISPEKRKTARRHNIRLGAAGAVVLAAALAIAAMRGGAVGSLPCALLTAETLARQVAEIRSAVTGPLNLNFFCHTLPDPPDETAWRALLAPYYAEEGVTSQLAPPPLRRPFDDALCTAVEHARPEIVSFHFGLPESALLDRVRASGAASGNRAAARSAAV